MRAIEMVVMGLLGLVVLLLVVRPLVRRVLAARCSTVGRHRRGDIRSFGGHSYNGAAARTDTRMEDST
jgi:hypothetical protein